MPSCAARPLKAGSDQESLQEIQARTRWAGIDGEDPNGHLRHSSLRFHAGCVVECREAEVEMSRDDRLRRHRRERQWMAALLRRRTVRG